MTREEVIRALEICATNDVHECVGCPYLGCTPDNYCFGNMAKDALALLKAQEPVVRCKDCTHWGNERGDGFNGFCDASGMCEAPDWYCADGQPREAST